MVLRKEDQLRLRKLLSEAIPILCRNGISYESQFSVEALIGITVDDKEVVLVSVNETVLSPLCGNVDSKSDEDVDQNESQKSQDEVPKVKSRRPRSQGNNRLQGDERLEDDVKQDPSDIPHTATMNTAGDMPPETSGRARKRPASNHHSKPARSPEGDSAGKRRRSDHGNAEHEPMIDMSSVQIKQEVIDVDDDPGSHGEQDWLGRLDSELLAPSQPLPAVSWPGDTYPVSSVGESHQGVPAALSGTEHATAEQYHQNQNPMSFQVPGMSHDVSASQSFHSVPSNDGPQTAAATEGATNWILRLPPANCALPALATTGDLQLPPGKQIYTCSVCRQQFCSKQGHFDHVRVMHLAAKLSRCRSCGASFKWRSQLQLHRKRCPKHQQLVSSNLSGDTKTTGMNPPSHSSTMVSSKPSTGNDTTGMNPS